MRHVNQEVKTGVLMAIGPVAYISQQASAEALGARAVIFFLGAAPLELE
jgi:hypothetical protein